MIAPVYLIKLQVLHTKNILCKISYSFPNMPKRKSLVVGGRAKAPKGIILDTDEEELQVYRAREEAKREEKRQFDEWYRGLLGQMCFYCNYRIETPVSDGRVYPRYPYRTKHLLPQCWYCNIAMNNNTPETFIALAHDIVHHLNDPAFTSALTSRAEAAPFPRWKTATEYRNHRVEITEQQRDDIISQSCTYCGLSNSNGIDRIDPRDHYTMGHIQPCCKICNYQKSVLTHAEFVAKLDAIITRHPHRPNNPPPAKKRD
jgi:hypothetical protein